MTEIIYIDFKEKKLIKKEYNYEKEYLELKDNMIEFKEKNQK